MMVSIVSTFVTHPADDLPADPAARDALLLRLMGSPDARQIDGLGGAHPLTSKVAVVSARPDGDVDYLFFQVVVDEAVVTDRRNCGNILAGVPGTASPGVLDYWGTAGSSCGALFPTGNRRDEFAGVEAIGVFAGASVAGAWAAPGTVVARQDGVTGGLVEQLPERMSQPRVQVTGASGPPGS